MFPLAFVVGSLQGHWWGFISRNYVVWPVFFLMNVFIALKGTHFWFLFAPKCLVLQILLNKIQVYFCDPFPLIICIFSRWNGIGESGGRTYLYKRQYWQGNLKNAKACWFLPRLDLGIRSSVGIHALPFRSLYSSMSLMSFLFPPIIFPKICGIRVWV